MTSFLRQYSVTCLCVKIISISFVIEACLLIVSLFYRPSFFKILESWVLQLFRAFSTDLDAYGALVVTRYVREITVLDYITNFFIVSILFLLINIFILSIVAPPILRKKRVEDVKLIPVYRSFCKKSCLITLSLLPFLGWAFIDMTLPPADIVSRRYVTYAISLLILPFTTLMFGTTATLLFISWLHFRREDV